MPYPRIHPLGRRRCHALGRSTGGLRSTGPRLTGNIICDTEAEGIFLEMDHGPMLIDNNVLLGGGVRANSENMVFAHNLFVDCPYRDQPDAERQSQFYTPHTTRVLGRKPGLPANNQWYNNLFVGQTLEDGQGRPITVNTDLLGRRFDRRLPGPLATLQPGENRVSWQTSPAPPVESPK